MVHFVHVGMMKTGSTYLQKGLFSKHPELLTIGHNYLAYESKEAGRLVKLLFRESYEASQWQRDFRALVDSIDTQGRHLGISHERLGGDFRSVGHRYAVPGRIMESIGPTKIILVLRHPLTFIASGYSQSIRTGTEVHPLEALLGDDQTCREIADALDYRRLVAAYESVFGPEQVLVLPFELLKEDRTQFLSIICEFLGIAQLPLEAVDTSTRNPKLSAVGGRILIRTNQWFKHSKQLRKTAHALVNRLDRALGLKPIADLPSTTPETYPALGEVLCDENYEIWHGELARFNYTF